MAKKRKKKTKEEMRAAAAEGLLSQNPAVKTVRRHQLDRTRRQLAFTAAMLAAIARAAGLRVGVMNVNEAWLKRLPQWPFVIVVELVDPIDKSKRIVAWNIHEDDAEATEGIPQWEGPLGPRMRSEDYAMIADALHGGIALPLPGSTALRHAVAAGWRDPNWPADLPHAELVRTPPSEQPWGLEESEENQTAW